MIPCLSHPHIISNTFSIVVKSCFHLRKLISFISLSLSSDNLCLGCHFTFITTLNLLYFIWLLSILGQTSSLNSVHTLLYIISQSIAKQQGLLVFLKLLAKILMPKLVQRPLFIMSKYTLLPNLLSLVRLVVLIGCLYNLNYWASNTASWRRDSLSCNLFTHRPLRFLDLP